MRANINNVFLLHKFVELPLNIRPLSGSGRMASEGLCHPRLSVTASPNRRGHRSRPEFGNSGGHHDQILLLGDLGEGPELSQRFRAEGFSS